MRDFRVVVLALGLAALWTGAANAGNLVVNGGFEGPPEFAFGDSAYRSKERFSEIKPFGWQGGDKLTFLSAPSFATVIDSTALSVWTEPAATSPDGGYFVMADGDPVYSDAFYQTLNNLTIGQTYAVSFYQAAGQNSDKVGPTWEEWKVGFGDHYQSSRTMYTPSKGIHPWEKQVLFFVADAVSEKLSFLAVGGPGGGPETGLPPVSFLDGVYVSAVPEPNSFLISASGIAGLVCLSIWRRRRIAATSSASA